MRVPTRHNDRRQTDVAMTPMIDVVFQLMIFFICTASFQAAEEVLPSSLAITGGTSAHSPIDVEPDLERIVVRGTHQAGATNWIVNERPCPTTAEVRQVLQTVAAIDRTLPVVLDVSGDVPLGDMINVYDLCRLEGFDKIQFAARRQ
jgi:biopolymer transport protein ExbD